MVRRAPCRRRAAAVHWLKSAPAQTVIRNSRGGELRFCGFCPDCSGGAAPARADLAGRHPCARQAAAGAPEEEATTGPPAAEAAKGPPLGLASAGPLPPSAAEAAIAAVAAAEASEVRAEAAAAAAAATAGALTGWALLCRLEGDGSESPGTDPDSNGVGEEPGEHGGAPEAAGGTACRRAPAGGICAAEPGVGG